MKLKVEGSLITMAKGEKKVVVKEERKVIKETRYCKVYKAVSILMIIISLKIRMVKL